MPPSQKTSKGLDLIIALSLVLAAEAISFVLSLKPLWGGILLTVLPLLYLAWRESLPWKKILFASLTLGLLLGAFFDLIQSFNAAWSTDVLVIPWKVFGVLPVDNLLGYFLMTALTISFYEYFFKTESHGFPIPNRYFKITAVVASITVLVFLLFAFWPQALNIPFAYLLGGLAATLATIYSVYRRPFLLDRCLRMSALFFVIWFVEEIVVLHTAGWSFGGQYIGWVSVFGVSFPFEELFFWMFWYAPFLVVTYEYIMRPRELRISKISSTETRA